MKKTWLRALAGGLAVSALFALAACGDHEHLYDGYRSDENGHWQVCTEDGEATEAEAHVYDDDKDATCNVCGYVREVDLRTEKEKTIDYIKSLNDIEVTGTNVYGSSYDEMVAYLIEKGVVDAAASPVDINATAGYFKKYDGTYDDFVATADKAYDYNGVYLFWWDIANGSEYFDYWSGLKTNSGTIIVAGGEYTLPMTTSGGCYAIAFKEVVDTDRSLVWDYTGDESYDDFTARKEAAMNEVKAKYAEEIAAFESIDATPCSIVFYTSVTELAVALQKAGYISVAELASPQDLNAVYTDENGKSVALASTAEKYGKITIYFYDKDDSWFMWNNFYNTYNEFRQNVQTNGTSSARAYYEVAAWTYDVYTLESGEELVLSADLVIGNFVIAVED